MKIEGKVVSRRTMKKGLERQTGSAGISARKEGAGARIAHSSTLTARKARSQPPSSTKGKGKKGPNRVRLDDTRVQIDPDASVMTAIVETADMDTTAASSSTRVAEAEQRARSWIVDTGAGHDVIGRGSTLPSWMEQAQTTRGKYKVTTANGMLPVTKMLSLCVPVLDEIVEPMVLEDTPPLLAVGKRCMYHGYSFMWKAGQKPYFIRPDGGRIDLEVRNNVPVLLSDGVAPWRNENIEGVWRCEQCDVQCNCADGWNTHISSKLHLSLSRDTIGMSRSVMCVELVPDDDKPQHRQEPPLRSATEGIQVMVGLPAHVDAQVRYGRPRDLPRGPARQAHP